MLGLRTGGSLARLPEAPIEGEIEGPLLAALAFYGHGIDKVKFPGRVHARHDHYDHLLPKSLIHTSALQSTQRSQPQAGVNVLYYFW